MTELIIPDAVSWIFAVKSKVEVENQKFLGILGAKKP